MLQTVARELRSGTTLATAVVVAAEAGASRLDRADPAAAVLARSVRRGTPLGAAVETWMGPTPSGARRLAGTALVLAAETGGTTAVVVDGVADTLRDRVALEREVGALSSQARASAVVLVVAPVVVAVLATSADERIAAFLLGTPLGWACVVAGLLLDAVGAAWMHLTIRRAT
nr:type II secretion system F family protein [Rhabdothermincola salaria]